MLCVCSEKGGAPGSSPIRSEATPTVRAHDPVGREVVPRPYRTARSFVSLLCSTRERGPQHTEVLSHLDSNDSRMQQVFYANGKVWGALDTAVTVGGANKAGIAYFVVKPDLSTGTLAGSWPSRATWPSPGT